ncbi:hypothetical protein ABVK25_001502 [Lepraria finkii]|uniref:Uncharacterized protein n=1 Tax=Lepraria finkii TaxID=1340010 RepID=A0ABR4BJM3_9LECA
MIGYNETVIKPGNLPCYCIDAGFTQTCRIIYKETTPILYGVNEFQLNSPTDVGSFQRHGSTNEFQMNKLDWTIPSHYYYCHPVFHFKLAPYGRLTMLRTIHLKLETTGTS